MKKFYYVLAALILAGFFLPVDLAWGQEAQEKKKIEEKKVQEEMMLKELELQKAQQKEEEMKRAIERYRTQSRRAGVAETFVIPETPDVPNYVWTTGVPFRSDNSFSLSFKKTFDGESISKKSTFTVDDDVKKLRFSVNGACKEGEINVKILLPGGKTFNQVQIDSSADINWSQSLTLDEESSQYKGEWALEIKSSNAKGMYSLSVTTY